ncbi:hypothetical protein COLO4_09215 [Corchorus olitorius]|uniref:Uncharacterized protein n=1 Tax=Corchorus olitorius TaxID=93759 RepID=A0A1R3KCX1_9ROSI|nr:hypothetical protein COLO4_09215 [Corchorus olitorius]
MALLLVGMSSTTSRIVVRLMLDHDASLISLGGITPLLACWGGQYLMAPSPYDKPNLG